MKCPYCGNLGDKVVDSRESKEGEVIRRRRECLECGKRFTSYERIDEIPYMVVKKDGTRERFDRLLDVRHSLVERLRGFLGRVFGHRHRGRRDEAGERAILTRIWQERGFTEAEAASVVETLFAHPERRLEAMMRDEVGLDPKAIGGPWAAAVAWSSVGCGPASPFRHAPGAGPRPRGSAIGSTPFTSAIATIGRSRTKRSVRVKNSPKPPTIWSQSTHVGWNCPHAPGRKSRWSGCTMTTNRSYHIPTLTHVTTINTNHGVRRHHLNQNTWGTNRLHVIITQ